MYIRSTLLALFIMVVGHSLFAQTKDYPISPIPFSEVKIQDYFWGPKIKTNQEVTIPIAIEQSKKTGRIDNFKIAAGMKEGQFCTKYPFDDSDVYKIIEAASYSIISNPDSVLEDRMDLLIDFIAKAQEEDGYLYTNRTIGKNVHEWAGDQRWELVHELSHELYNLGHMFEAAVAHYSATEKRNFLDVAIKSADLICEKFGEGKIENYPGHQEVEIGLVKLYRVTGKKKYLDLAKFFLDVRGKEGVGNPKKYNQSHQPVVRQNEAVGHAVRGSYMWTAMADIAAITGDKSYLKAIEDIWQDIVSKKLYINGGIGATGNGEAFGEAYELPNMTAYCETCAGVGNAKWNHRMFLMTGDSKYIDVLERTMYNNIIDGVSLSGDRFFYPNPLASNGQHERSEWFGCACCPPNVARFLPSMPGYIYGQKEDDIYVNLYISSQSTFDVDSNAITLKMESEFPWQGGVNIKVTEADSIAANLKLRIPGYIRNQPVPSDLYYYLDKKQKDYKVKINDEPIDITVDEMGYATISRAWKKGDLIALDFPMEVEMIKSNAKVKDNADKIAFERGPLLYCAEWPDNPDGRVLSLVVDPETPFNIRKANTLNGIYVIDGEAKQVSRRLEGGISLSKDQNLTLIPYHLWNNRGPGQMSVWIATKPEVALPNPAPTIAYNSDVSASKESGSINALVDQLSPEHSNDRSVGYLHWWPNKGTEEWVQFDFDGGKEVSKVKVYWFDDGPEGGCRVPASWEVQYQFRDQWRPVAAKGKYPVSKDEWNIIEFVPAKTNALRVVIQLPEEHASGLYEIVIE